MRVRVPAPVSVLPEARGTLVTRVRLHIPCEGSGSRRHVVRTSSWKWNGISWWCQFPEAQKVRANHCGIDL